MNNKSIDTQFLINELLKFLRLSITNIKIYPITSPLVESQIHQLYSIIKKLLYDKDYISISEMGEKIFVNTEEYIPKDPTSFSNSLYLTKFFIQVGIKSITLKKEVKIEELKEILVALVTKKPKLTTKEVVQQVIQEKKINNITIDEVEFVSVLKSDQSIKSILRMISSPVSDLASLMNMLSRVFSEFDKVENENTKKQLLNAVSKYVSSLDIQIVKELFTQTLPPKIEQIGFKQQVFNNLTKQNVEEIFNEIINWCKRIRAETVDESEYLEQLQNLKEFIKLVVNSPVSKLVPVDIIEELFKIGLLDALPDWIEEQKEKKSWITYLDEILNTNEPVKLLQEEFLNSLQENVEKLCIIGLDDKLEKFTSLMAENLSNPVVKLRQLAANSLNDISANVIKYNKINIVKNIIPSIIKYFFKEQSEEVISQYIEILFQTLSNLVLAKDYTSFVFYSKQLLQFAEEIKNFNQQKYTLVDSLLVKIFKDTKDAILEDLLNEEQPYFNEILWFLNYVSESSVDILINAVVNSDNPQVRNLLSQILVKNQKIVIDKIIKYLNLEVSNLNLARMINILKKFDYDFSPFLIKLYKYVNYVNKINIINYIYQKQPTDENLGWLVTLLVEEDDQIIEYILDIIILLRYKPANKQLIKLLSIINNKDLKKRICLALGVLKEIESIKPLRKIIFSKPKLFGIIKGEDLEVRMSACLALGNFITLPEIKSLMNNLTKSKEKEIANIAKEIIQSKSFLS